MNCRTEHCEEGISHRHLPPNEGIGAYIHQGYCFTCSYWQDRADQDRLDDRAFVVENGDGLWHYVAGRETGGNPRQRGSYGEHYLIEVAGSDPIGTESLWSQGPIPAEWAHLFDGVQRGRFLR